MKKANILIVEDNFITAKDIQEMKERYIQNTFRDITEHKRAEEALRKLNDPLVHMFVNSSPPCENRSLGR